MFNGGEFTMPITGTTPERMVLAMTEMLNNEDYATITIRRIMRAAGIRTNDHRRYFENKLAVSREVVKLSNNELTSELDRLNREFTEPLMRIIVSVNRLMKHLDHWIQFGDMRMRLFDGVLHEYLSSIGKTKTSKLRRRQHETYEGLRAEFAPHDVIYFTYIKGQLQASGIEKSEEVARNLYGQIKGAMQLGLFCHDRKFAENGLKDVLRNIERIRSNQSGSDLPCAC